MTGVVTADPLGVLIAFGAGILSFLSPCVLPLVPGYLSMVSGLSAAELGASRRAGAVPTARTSGEGDGEGDREGEVHRAGAVLVPAAAAVGGGAAGGNPGMAAGGGPGGVGTLVRGGDDARGARDPHHARGARTGAGPRGGGTGAGAADPGRRALVPLVRGILLFIAGFTVVFVALGAGASGLHAALESHKAVLGTAAGGLVVLLGAVMLVSALPARAWTLLGARASGRVAWILGERRLHLRPQSLGSWAAPVMGMAFAFAWTPCLGPVLAAILAMAALRSSLDGGMLLLFAYSLGLGVPFLVTGVAFDRLTTFYGRARRGLAWVQVAAALVLVAFGVVLLTGHIGWVSTQFRLLLDHLGLRGLTTA